MRTHERLALGLGSSIAPIRDAWRSRERKKVSAALGADFAADAWHRCVDAWHLMRRLAPALEGGLSPGGSYPLKRSLLWGEVELENLQPCLARESESLLNVAARKEIGNVVVDAGYSLVLLGDALRG